MTSTSSVGIERIVNFLLGDGVSCGGHKRQAAFGFPAKTTGESGKAALSRPHSKTWRTCGGESCARSVVECGTQFRSCPSNRCGGLIERILSPALHRSKYDYLLAFRPDR